MMTAQKLQRDHCNLHEICLCVKCVVDQSNLYESFFFFSTFMVIHIFLKIFIDFFTINQDFYDICHIYGTHDWYYDTTFANTTKRGALFVCGNIT